jgi:hypothetical protein
VRDKYSQVTHGDRKPLRFDADAAIGLNLVQQFLIVCTLLLLTPAPAFQLSLMRAEAVAHWNGANLGILATES